MAEIAVQEIDRDGIAPTMSPASSGGDKCANDGATHIFIKNGGGSQRTVTLDIRQEVDGQAVTDRTVDIAAGTEKFIGPFPKVIYDDDQENVNWTYDAVTSVTVCALRHAAET